MTALEISLRGTQKFVEFMKAEWKKEKENSKKKANLSRVSHSLIGQGWRPEMDEKGATQVPRALRDLIDICWSEFPEQRPTFVEVAEFVKHTLRAEVMGIALEHDNDKLNPFMHPMPASLGSTGAGTGKGTRAGRRTSVGLVGKIKEIKERKSTKKLPLVVAGGEGGDGLEGELKRVAGELARVKKELKEERERKS